MWRTLLLSRRPGWPTLGVGLLLAACGPAAPPDRPGDTAPDTGPGDTSPDDTSPGDTGPDDTGDTGPDHTADTAPLDADGDGVPPPADCDDADPTVHPGADERCGGADEDCDGETDEPSAVDAPLWYTDADADGWGQDGPGQPSCTPVEGRVLLAGDCDDEAASVHPGAEERCDTLDADCDGQPDDDDAVDAATWWADADRDTYGDPAVPTTACAQPRGHADNPDDCDDADRDVNPDAKESCDDADVDEDCDGLVDDADPSLDAASLLTWYEDADGDGYGSPNRHVPGCAGPEGWVDNRLDCQDDDATISPAVEERCDDAGLDEDCDGAVDDSDSTLDPAYVNTLYRDMDGDGWGVETNTTQRCDEGAGWVEGQGDCDDHDFARHPDAAEQCGNEVDEDCDGSTECPP